MRSLAVVTGANRGLGAALARCLAMSGCSVLLTGRDAPAVGRLAATLASTGLPAFAYPAALDVSDMRSVRNFAEHCARSQAVPEVLINNAAVCERGWTRQVVRRSLKTNVIGPLALCRELGAVGCAAPRRARRLRVLNVSSGDGELVYLNSALQDEFRRASSVRTLLQLLARVTPPRQTIGGAPAHSPTPAYSVSKAALNALTRILAGEHAGGTSELCASVWFAAVCPGDVSTRMCSIEPREALSADAAAHDLVWLLRHAEALPSGKFWRQCEAIPF
jgi:NAD(P)-dependent dehydrogenase (short-subunit alcohol dehydrogenase family)